MFIQILNTFKIFFIDFIFYSKYFLFFNLFLGSLSVNGIYYLFFENINSYLINFFNYTINLNGAALIKLVQWVYNYFKFGIIDKYIYIRLFERYYENCSLHSLNYSKKVFKKETDYFLEDVIQLDENNIKSGSIAQVYKGKVKKNFKNFTVNQLIAIKIVHPEVKYQFLFPINFIKFFLFFIDNFNCFNNYSLPMNTVSFLEGIKKQIDMNYEFKNMEYFHLNHLNHPLIEIPKPLFSTNNILIMEYKAGEFLEELDISFRKKTELISYLSLFIKYNYYVSDFIHCDLHDSNWKVYKTDEKYYKIIIYDFGYVIPNNNYIKESLKLLMPAIDFNKSESISVILFNLLEPNNKIKNKEEFKKIINEYHNNYQKSNNFLADNLIKIVGKICIDYNLKFSYEPMFELLISILLIRDYFNKYLHANCKKIIIKNDNKNDYVNLLFTITLTFDLILQKNNCYHEIKEYLKKYYLESEDLKEIYQYNTNYLEEIKSDTNIDI